MGFNIVLHPDADLEIDEAIDWLNEQQPGLGKAFFEVTRIPFHIS